MSEKNGKHSVTLSTGDVVKVDIEAVRAGVKTRKDAKRIAALEGKSDAYDAMLAGFTDQSVEQLENMDLADWKAVDHAVGEAMKEVFGPNAR